MSDRETPNWADKKQFFQAVVETISLAFGQQPACLWLLDEDRKQLRVIAAIGLADEYTREAVLALDEPSVAREVLQTGQTIVVPTIATDKRWKYKPEAAAHGLKSAIVAPLRIKQSIVGVLDVYWQQQRRKFSDFEVRLVESFANQVAAAQRRLREAEALNEISLTMNSAWRSETLLEQTMKSVARTLECDRVSLFLLDKAGTLHQRATSAETRQRSFPPGVGVAGWVAQTGLPLNIADAQQDARFVPGLSSAADGPRSMLAVPMPGVERCLGVIVADMMTEAAFDEHDQRLLETLARQIAIVIQNTELLKREALLRKVDTAISQTLKPDETLEMILAGALELTGMQSGVIYLVNETGTAITACFEYPAGFGHTLPRLDNENAMTRSIIRTGQPIPVSDVSREPRVNPAMLKEKGVHSLIGVPLLLDHRVIGVLYLNENKRRVFDSADIELLMTLAGRAAIAVRNAQLYERAETLRETARIANSARSIAEVMDVVLDQLREVVEYNSASVQLIQGERRALVRGRGFSVENSPAELRRNISQDPLISKVVYGRRPLVISDVKDEPLWSHIPETAHVRSWMGIPLVVRGQQVVGLLTIDHSQPGFYTPETGELATAFADQVAIALHNSAQAQALASLNQLTQQLLSIEKAQDVRTLLEQIAQGALEVLSADIIEFYEYRQDQNKIELPPISRGELYGPYVPKGEIRKDDIIIELMRQAQPLYIKNTQTNELFCAPFVNRPPDWPAQRFAVREKIQSNAFIPLRTLNETVGFMFINYRLPQEFADDQVRLIELFASQAAIAIKNARLHTALKNRIEDLDALNKIGRALTSGIRLQELDILELVHAQICQLFDANNMYIALYDEATDTVRFGLAYVDGQRIDVERDKGWQPRQGGKGKTEEIIKTRKPIFHATRAEAEAWYAQPGHEEYVGGALPSWLGVPVMIGEKVLGVIATYHPTRDYVYDKDDLKVLQSIADQAAIALDNANMFYDINRRLETLVEFGQELTAGIHLSEAEILELIHSRAGELMDANNMYIALYDEATDTVRFGLAYVDGQRIDVQQAEGWQPRRAGKGRTEEIIRTKKPIFTATKEEAEAWYAQPGHEEYVGTALASWLGVPMLAGEKVLGVIATYHPTRDYVYSGDDLKILQGLANQAAVAIQNARLYRMVEAAQRKIADTEAVMTRTFIAADFVHRMNNLAGTIPIWVDLIYEALNKQNAETAEVTTYLKEIQKDTEGLLTAAEELRHPPAPQQIDIAPILESVLRPVSIQYPDKIKTRVEVQPELHKVMAVPASLANAIGNIVSNGADAILAKGEGTLAIRADNYQDSNGANWVRIVIKDDGVGIPDQDKDKIFAPFFTTKESGMGYGLWRSRTIIVGELGGKIDLESSTETGTTFTLLLPALP